MRPEHNPRFPVDKLRDPFVCSYCLQPVRRGGCGDIIESGRLSIVTCVNAPRDSIVTPRYWPSFQEEYREPR